MSGEDAQPRTEAAEWLSRLHSRTVTTDELAQFARWRRDPANASAYREAEAFWDASGGLADDPDIGGIVDAARQRRRVARWWARPRNRLLPVGAGVALAAVLFTFHLWPTSNPAYRTAVGERSIARLDDGTTMQMDTDTVVSTELGARERRVRLDRGQAFFAVRHDPSRPFIVEADGITVTALGTRFDVDHLGDRVTVSLVQGSVAVRATASGRSVRLNPGESVTITDGAIGDLVRGRTGELTSWREGRLSFRNASLETAVSAMNRYTDRPIIIRSMAARVEPISGDFSTDDVDGFVSAVDALFGTGAVQRSSPR